MNRILLAFALTMSLAVSAHATCPEGPMFDGPVQTSLFEADQALGRSACPRSEISLAGAGSAILDTPHFYGTLAGAGVLRGSWAMDKDTELFATFDTAQMRFIQNATLSETAWTLGQASIGATRHVWGNDRFDLSPSLRLVLPTSTAYVNAHPFAVDVAALARWQLIDSIALHGQLGFTTSAAFSAGPSDALFGAQLLVGGAWSPWKWFAVVAEVGALLGNGSALYHLTAGGGLRFAFANHFGIELAAVLPLVGADRTTFAGGLRFGYRF